MCIRDSYSQFRKSLADIQNSIKTDLDVSQELNEVPRIMHENLNFDDEDPAPSFDPPPEEDWLLAADRQAFSLSVNCSTKFGPQAGLGKN